MKGMNLVLISPFLLKGVLGEERFEVINIHKIICGSQAHSLCLNLSFISLMQSS